MDKYFVRAGILLSVAVMMLCVAGCASGPELDSNTLRDAMSKTPLPPGITEYEIHGNDFERSFYVSAESTDVAEDDIIAFYQAYFDENGWENNFPADEEIDGMLDYMKGRELLNVTTTQEGDQLDLMVSYRLFDHTPEEFEALIVESADPDALELATAIINTYAEFTSYRDTGTLEQTYDDGNISENATFKTAYVAPDKLRFSYSESPDGFYPTRCELAMRGETVTSMGNYDDSPEIGDDVSLAIAGFYGVTSTTSGNIPELLIKEESVLFRLAHLTLIEDATLDDGTVCIRLQGTDFIGEESTLWVGKADHLIRRIDSRSDSKNWSSITYQPEINTEIRPEVFNFTPPTL